MSHIEKTWHDKKEDLADSGKYYARLIDIERYTSSLQSNASYFIFEFVNDKKRIKQFAGIILNTKKGKDKRFETFINIMKINGDPVINSNLSFLKTTEIIVNIVHAKAKNGFFYHKIVGFER